MGVQIVAKDASVIMNIKGVAKANIMNVISVPGWNQAGSPQGPNFPLQTLDAGYGDHPWSGDKEIKEPNDIYASCVHNNPGDYTFSNFLTGYDFAFNLPNASTVDGIEVFVEARTESGGDCWLNMVTLYVDDYYPTGNLVGELTNLFIPITTTDEIYTVGGPTNLFGAESIPYSTINNSTFNVGISFQAFMETVYVDAVSVKVYFTP